MKIQLSDNGNYRTVLHADKIESLPWQVDIKITSQWLGAKNPDEVFVKAQCIISHEVLKDIARGLLAL